MNIVSEDILKLKERIVYSKNSKLKGKDREDNKISLSYNESVLNNIWT